MLNEIKISPREKLIKKVEELSARVKSLISDCKDLSIATTDSPLLYAKFRVVYWFLSESEALLSEADIILNQIKNES